MKSNTIGIMEFIQPQSRRFTIPVYQRSYEWKIANCRQLFNDLVKVIKNKKQSHFFGSIVAVSDSDALTTDYLIIDGQQRLTTVVLLLLAIYSLLKDNAVESKDRKLKAKIFDGYLTDPYASNEVIKLRPVRGDYDALKKLFDGNASGYISGSNLTINYKFFCEQIQKNDITIDELFEAVCKLKIICITLNTHDGDEPQRIFESLNSTGMALTEGDKIRNYILMGLSAIEQNTFYEKYWKEIEAKAGDVTAFVRDWLSVCQSRIPSKERVYFAFKEYAEQNEKSNEVIATELLKYSKWYSYLINGNTGDNELDRCIFRLNRLETSVTRPFFLEVLRLRDEGELSETQVMDIFRITENYLFRRTICDIPTNALNKIFLTLHRTIERLKGNTDDYVERLKYVLVTKGDRNAFPDDDAFIASFREKDVYHMRKANVYILERFESYASLGAEKYIFTNVDSGVYTIEHIMPQTLTTEWKVALGDDFEDIYDHWINRLANLTLTSVNPKLGNKQFIEKKKIGYVPSGFQMNSDIAKCDSWGLPELEKRNESLMDTALKIWPFPTTSFISSEIAKDVFHTLEEESDFTGQAITKFKFGDKENIVSSWADMAVEVVRMLHAKDKSVLYGIAASDSNDEKLSAYFNSQSSELIEAYKLDTDLYMERNTSTQLKIAMLKKLFDLYGEDPEVLTFYTKKTSDNSSDALRYEYRLRYWAFALPRIRAANAKNGCFRLNNPCKSNWSGSNIISGVSINCVIKIDSANVALYIGYNNSVDNKKLFDRLFKCRSDIEEKIGISLVWNRGDNIKASYVSCSIKNVGLMNENSWESIVQFHMEYSSKFYSVFAPYLKSE